MIRESKDLGVDVEKRQGVNVVPAWPLSHAPARGEEVEFPFGKLRRVPRSWSELDKPQAKRRYKVKWEWEWTEKQMAEDAWERSFKQLKQALAHIKNLRSDLQAGGH